MEKKEKKNITHVKVVVHHIICADFFSLGAEDTAMSNQNILLFWLKEP